MKSFSIAITCLALATVLTGCATMQKITEIGTGIGVSTGLISPTAAKAANSTAKVAVSLNEALKSITPKNEYYIGRTVSATILHDTKPCNNPKATQYVNELGQILTLFSDKPETYGGYHFIILDTDDINAFAAPGGFVLVSRGLLRCCKTEDELAAVLAHEIGHIQLNHGMKSISSGRWTKAGLTLLAETARNLTHEQVGQLTDTFEGCVSDITKKMVKKGYDHKSEHQADKAAVEITARLGYDSSAIVRMLEQMNERLKPDASDFATTHPSPEKRIAEVKKHIHTKKPPLSKARQTRFEQAMRGI